MNQRMIFVVGVISLIFLCSLSSQAIIITDTTNAETLANQILGTGISIVGVPTYTGVANQSGIFTDGSGIGFNTGIVLTSGDVREITGSISDSSESLSGGMSDADDISTRWGTGGDEDLSTLSGFSTYDAAVLEFNFQFGEDGSTGGDLSFNFVFASEEYINFIDSYYNDVFGFFVDGDNVGLVPGTSDKITVNTVNNSFNSEYYRNNVNNTDGIPVVEGLNNNFDGLTTVITAEALGLGPGTHTMKFAVADAYDGWLDAGVFIQAGTFSSENPTSPSPVPEPATMLLLGFGLLVLAGFRRRLK